MKKNMTALALGLILCSAAAMASDGTVSVNGTVTANTCTITGTAGKNVTVTLPTVGATSLATAGQTAGATPFSISLSSCPTGFTKAQTHFEVGSTVDATTGNLLNSGTASNVEVQLLNNSLQAINVTNNTNSQLVAITSGSATLNYYAQYIATGAAAAGSVSSTVQYSMTYQ